MTEDQSATRTTKKAAPKAPDPVVTPHVAAGLVAEGDLVEVYTTMRPDQPMLVSRAEALDLFNQGLLVKEEKDAS